MIRWNDDGDLYLLTKEEFDLLPNGIELGCIDGEIVVKGKDYIDEDTRGGFLAYGLHSPYDLNHQYKYEIAQMILATKPDNTERPNNV
ncbi:MAG TPA: hypothetical protein VFM18_18655 [Methanosarcina sp.]|nr:hypothetical protein [Methanosarcina sp.]